MVSVESRDSGAECLATLLQFHKIIVGVEQITRNFAADGNALDHITLLRAARGLGLTAKLEEASLSRLERLNLPLIAENKDGTFFIIARTIDQTVLIQSPPDAPSTISFEELEKLWTGRVILATTRDVVAGDARKFDISWFIPSLVRYRRLFGEVIAASFFIQLFGLVSPLFFQVVVDKVLVHRGLTTLDVLVIGLLLITLFDVVLGGLRTYIFAHTTSRVDVELSARLFHHLMALPLAYFETRATGQTVARVRELENVRDFLTGSAVTVLLDLLFTFVFIAVMFLYSSVLTWIVIGSLPFYVVISVLITPALRARIEEKFQRGAVNQAFLVETVSGVETLKALAVEPRRRQKWEEQLAAYVKSSFRAVTLSMIGGQSIQLVSRVVMALVLWLGARLVIEGGLTIGQLIAFNLLAGQVNGPVLRLSQLWQDFQQFRVAIERLGDVLNMPCEPAFGAGRQSLPTIRGAVVFERVNFRYRPDGPEVLRDLSLKIQPGQTIGIVGRSGSGKSTLTKLLQRLYAPQQGRILVDGIDLAQVDPSWLRGQVGVVLQENVLFSGTVRDNIAMARPTAAIERVMAVAEMAGAHEFILELTQGYDTMIEERGANLSGGQRQRIAIARALITDPRILIFDEATSALDYESERIIRQNMKTISVGRTVIIVAHRLSTVRHANRIVVIEKGRVIEDAPHDELVRRGGAYARLWRQQAE